jgi:hypothetical protein
LRLSLTKHSNETILLSYRFFTGALSLWCCYAAGPDGYAIAFRQGSQEQALKATQKQKHSILLIDVIRS